MFMINMEEILPIQGYNLMVNSVCGAVIISMLVKSLLIPRLHDRLTNQSPEQWKAELSWHPRFLTDQFRVLRSIVVGSFVTWLLLHKTTLTTKEAVLFQLPFPWHWTL